jgi:hypothetical protein
MALIDLAAPALQLLDALDLPLAHPLDYPHVEPSQAKDDGGGTSPVLVGGGVVATLALTGGLIWVRERARKAEQASAALEGDADAQTDEQRAGPAVEPGDHGRPRQEPA